MSETIDSLIERLKVDVCSDLTARFDSVKTNICPDQYVGVIGSLRSNGFDWKATADRPRNIHCVIMILESPHIHEFEEDVGPAKGCTGRLLCKHILEVNGLCRYKEYGLLLMNAVQYQCSLGYPTKCFRDKIFQTLWDPDEFKGRLTALFREGDVVLNCCTKGYGSSFLRDRVQMAVEDWRRGTTDIEIPVLRRTHPSSWHSKKNRRAEWEIRRQVRH